MSLSKNKTKKQTFFSQVVLVVCFKGLDCEDLVFFCVFIPDPPWPLIVPGCVSFPWLPFVYLILPVFLVESSSCLPSMSLLSVPWYQFLPIFYFFPYATAAMRADFGLTMQRPLDLKELQSHCCACWRPWPKEAIKTISYYDIVLILIFPNQTILYAIF